MKKNRHRRVAGLATVLACLAVMATPAAATTSTGTITGGSVSIIQTGGTTEILPLGGTGGAGCGSSAAAVETGTGTTATLDITGFTNTSRFTLSTGVNHYVEVMTRLASTPGSIAGSPSTDHSANSGTLTVRTEIFYAANNSSTATDCATGTRACRLTSTFHLTAWWTSSTPITASRTIHVNSPAATIAVTPPCAAPFSLYNGGTTKIDDATFHVDDVT